MSDDGGQPAYRRLAEAIRDGILSGRFRPGEKLPPTRTLAANLSLARNTILEAYEQLIAEGYLTARHGSGTFVAEPGLRHADQTTMKAVTDQIDLLIGQCIHMGLDGPAIRRLIEDRLAQFKGPTKGDHHG